jgi:hypothetical protein
MFTHRIADMKRTPKPSHAKEKKIPEPAQEQDAEADVEAVPIVERPDGYYWSGLDGREEFGPYESYELAASARDAQGDEAIAPGDALLEAEREIGIADWIDAETGEPAEGQSPPHLQED